MIAKFPTTVEELPDGEFFAILYPESISIPGDERSRTNPGHGYPEYTVNHWRIEVYPTKEAWESEIKSLEIKNRTKYKAVRAMSAVVKTTTIVDVI